MEIIKILISLGVDHQNGMINWLFVRPIVLAFLKASEKVIFLLLCTRVKVMFWLCTLRLAMEGSNFE